MESRGRRAALAAAAIAIALAAGYWWWTRDERAIRSRMADIADALTIAPGEGTLGTVTRVATLRSALAPEISLSIDAPPAADGHGTAAESVSTIAGRDHVLALVGRWTPPPGGITVDFVDVQVTVYESRLAAEVYCTVILTTRDASGQESVDARELTASLTHLAGSWVVSSARAEPTLMR